MKWRRLPEGQQFLSNKIKYCFGKRAYTITIEPDTPNLVSIEQNHSQEVWHVEIVESNGKDLRISGLTVNHGGVIDEVLWFVFETGPVCKISYWHDKKIYREDLGNEVEI